jgi:hypothetical protein
MAAGEKLSTKAAIEQVMTGKRKMTVAEIAEAALPLTNLKGATPKQTFYSVLYGEAKKDGGLVVKAGDGGVFKLNPKRKTTSSERTPAKRGSTKRSPPSPRRRRREPDVRRHPRRLDQRRVVPNDRGRHRSGLAGGG